MRILAAGYMPVDVVYPSTGAAYRAIGGSSANVALILAYLGWDAGLAGQIGKDLVGDEFVREARASGVNVDLLRRAAGAESPRLLHRVDADGHSYAYTCPRCHQRFPRSRPLTLDLAQRATEVLEDVDVYYFDRVNAGTVRLAEHYMERNVVVMFEPSLPTGGELFQRSCEAASIIKYSSDVALPIPKSPSRSRPEQVRIVTDGAAGLEVQLGSSSSKHLPAIPTLTVDSSGAGDWTSSALLYSAVRPSGLQLADVEKGLRLGQALAALCCTVVGARGLMRLTRRTVLGRARKALEVNVVESPPRLPPAPASPVSRSHCAVCGLRTIRAAATGIDPNPQNVSNNASNERRRTKADAAGRQVSLAVRDPHDAGRTRRAHHRPRRSSSGS